MVLDAARAMDRKVKKQKIEFFSNFFSGKFFIPVALTMHRLRGVVAEAQGDACEVPAMCLGVNVGSRESSSAMSLGLIAGERARQRDAIVTTAFHPAPPRESLLAGVRAPHLGGLRRRWRPHPHSRTRAPESMLSKATATIFIFFFLKNFFFSKK